MKADDEIKPPYQIDEAQGNQLLVIHQWMIATIIDLNRRVAELESRDDDETEA